MVNSRQCQQPPGPLCLSTSFPRRQRYLISYLKNHHQRTSALSWETQLPLAKHSAKRRESTLDLTISRLFHSLCHPLILSLSETELLSESITHENMPLVCKEHTLGLLFQGVQCLNDIPGFWAFIWGLDTTCRHAFISFSSGWKSLSKPSGKRKGDRISSLGALMLPKCQQSHQQRHPRPFQTAFMSKEHANKAYLIRKKVNKLLHILES